MEWPNIVGNAIDKFCKCIMFGFELFPFVVFSVACFNIALLCFGYAPLFGSFGVFCFFYAFAHGMIVLCSESIKFIKKNW